MSVTEIPSVAMNCGLKAPPDGSGENRVHGTYLYVYPRDVPDNYTGCQTVWADDGNKWMVLYLEQGHPIIEKLSYPSDTVPYTCFYENGRLINQDERPCRKYDKSQKFGGLLYKSVAPGRDPIATKKMKELQESKSQSK